MYRKDLVLPAEVRPITFRTTHETSIGMADVQGFYSMSLHIKQIMCLVYEY